MSSKTQLTTHWTTNSFPHCNYYDLQIDKTTNYQQLPSALSTIDHHSTRPIKINSDEILFIRYEIDQHLDKMIWKSLRILKYNINRNQWQQKQIQILNESQTNTQHHLPTIHDIAYKINTNTLFMIDNIGKLWIVDINKNKFKTIKLDSQYQADDYNDPKLTIIDNKLYVLTPCCNDGRYIIDISNKNHGYQIKPLSYIYISVYDVTIN